MLKENQERIAWFDNPTERMKHTGQAIRDAAEKGGYGYRWWKANDIEHNEGYNALPMRSLTEHLNDPNFWKALEKARSWQDSGAWLFHWHRFVDHIAFGKDVDSFFREQPITGMVCCARAASGHATAAPPRAVMNSRRCSGRDVRFIARPPHRTVRAAFPHTAPTSGV